MPEANAERILRLVPKSPTSLPSGSNNSPVPSAPSARAGVPDAQRLGSGAVEKLNCRVVLQEQPTSPVLKYQGDSPIEEYPVCG